MNTRAIRLLAALLMILGACHTQANDVHESVQLEYLPAKAQASQFGEVRRSEHFVPLDKIDEINPAAAWFRFRLPEAGLQGTSDPTLRVPRYVIRGAQVLYVPVSDGSYDTLDMGETSVLPNILFGEFIALHLSDFSADLTGDFYIYLEAPYGLNPAISQRYQGPILLDSKQHFASESKLNAAFTAYATAIIILALYYLIFFTSTGNRAYLYYSLSAIAILVCNIFRLAYGYTTPPLTATISNAFMSLVYIFNLQFIRNFLRTPEQAPGYDRVLTFLVGWFVLAGVAIAPTWILYPNAYTAVLVFYLLAQFVSFPIVFALSWSQWRRGNRNGLYVLLGWSCIFVGGAVLGLVSHIYSNPGQSSLWFWIFTMHILEALIIAVGLGDEIAQLRKQRDAEQKNSLAMALQHREELEEKVRLRTMELEEKSAEQAMFFANASHEFRTPLTLIAGPLADLGEQDGTALSPKARANLGIARRNVDKLLSLIGDVLNINKHRNADAVINVAQYKLQDHLRTVCAQFEGYASQNSMTIDSSALNGDVSVYYDYSLLEKVFGNLFSNAIKYAGRDSTISVSVEDCENCVLVHLRDNGIGIAESDQEKIFQYYYRVNRSNYLQYSGTGIGLPYARQLVERHSGELTVRSQPGEYTCFTLKLRKGLSHLKNYQLVDSVEHFTLDDESSAIVIKETSELPAGDDAHDIPTLLIIDDNPELRAFLSQQLFANYRILQAEDGLQGLERARATLPDVVVCDVMMPNMNGYEFTKAIKSDPDTAHVPVILLTTLSANEETIEGLNVGADDYLGKPFDTAELSLRITNLLTARKALKRRLLRQQAAASGDQTGITRSPKELIEHHLETNIRKGLFTTEDLASSLAMARSTLYRRCKESFGTSPSELLRDAKLQYAYELLKQQQGNVGQVCYASGFESLSHFSKSFRERFGIKPSEVKRT